MTPSITFGLHFTTYYSCRHMINSDSNCNFDILIVITTNFIKCSTNFISLDTLSSFFCLRTSRRGPESGSLQWWDHEWPGRLTSLDKTCIKLSVDVPDRVIALLVNVHPNHSNANTNYQRQSIFPERIHERTGGYAGDKTKRWLYRPVYTASQMPIVQYIIFSKCVRCC